MLTLREWIDYQIETLKKESQSLKKEHEWGQWDNWREFMQLDIQINELKIKSLEKENEHFKQALEDYKDY